MTARPIRHNAQVPDRNGKIFYTSITSLSHISKESGHEAADGWRRRCPDWHHSGAPAERSVRLIFPSPDSHFDPKVHQQTSSRRSLRHSNK